MIIGIPKEIKSDEFRVGLTPASVRELVLEGHKVIVEDGLGAGIGFGSDVYRQSGATIVKDAKELFDKANIVVKVKEPQPSEIKFIRENQILFTYLHLAADRPQAEGLINSGAHAIAYETVTDQSGLLPLLVPMSEVAGRLSIQAGATCLERFRGGRGVLLGGVPGVMPATVMILGCGISGSHALKMAVGLGAECVVFEKSLDRLREIENQYDGRVITQYSTQNNIEEWLPRADLVIGAVLVPGRSAPVLVNKKQLSLMKKGSVVVDVAIDQGGCFETSKPTTHSSSTFEVDGVIHYCVANMPGAVARTSSVALNNATLPYVLRLAKHGLDALKHDPHFMRGLNISSGHVTYAPVADDLGFKYKSPEEVL
tara:strand:- start:6664 stop:7773 length:1110 start_codon:yes stop_codon:yes gene_type:complete